MPEPCKTHIYSEGTYYIKQVPKNKNTGVSSDVIHTEMLHWKFLQTEDLGKS